MPMRIPILPVAVFFLVTLLTSSAWGQLEHPELVPQVAHVGEIRTIEFSTDGEYLVSYSQDGQAKVWLVSSGVLVRPFRTTPTWCAGAALYWLEKPWHPIAPIESRCGIWSQLSQSEWLDSVTARVPRLQKGMARQQPRVFYRRETEARPMVIAEPSN